MIIGENGLKLVYSIPFEINRVLQVAVLDERGKVLNNSRVDNNLIKVNEYFDAYKISYIFG